ncbi:MAG TPA: hypothetical protein VGQ69_08905 [Gemmatimonadales bacterium]|jgi:hypothetical protein|nr:hypothetical protein [Gemmatimonadales bacterium]
MRRAGLLLFIGLSAAGQVTAQSWRLRFDASAQRVAFRGVTPDSIPEALVVPGPSGGPISPDSFAVTCFGDDFCRFYRPGPVRRGIPASASADLSMWGLGIRGLSVRMNLRMLGDLSGDRLWPGTAPALRLVEGYAEYVRGGLTARAGRVIEQGRLGSSGGGLDGAQATLRLERLNLTIGGYLGWGLARGTILPVTSPAVNPLLDFQPGSRQIVAGALAGMHLPVGSLEAEYRREVDPGTDYFVSERAALSLQARPAARVRVVAGADYDLAQGRPGSAEALLSYTGHNVWGTLGARHYRPFFDLWTVWGVFSPMPYNAMNGSLALRPIGPLLLRARGEWFRYDAAEISAPGVTLEDRGWRWALEGTATPDSSWTVELAVHDELRPGASSRGIDGRIRWHPRAALELALEGGRLERPLELRFQDAGLSWAGGSADYRVGERLRFGMSVNRYWEARDRPDAASFDWNQWRVSALVSLTLRSDADRWVLPPARRGGSMP